MKWDCFGTPGKTISVGFKKGSIVKHKKYGICYVGGTSNGKITLCALKDSCRLARNISSEDCKFLCYNSWSFRN